MIKTQRSMFGALEAPLTKHRQPLDDESRAMATVPRGVSFAVPPVAEPAELLQRWTDDSHGEYKIRFAHGTTTLAFKFKEGIMVAVDSRATAGPYIASQTVKKVIEINPYLLGTMAGGAADCSFWERQLAMQCRIYELRNKERISVAAASKLLANMVYNYKGMGLSMGPGLFYVDNDGTRLRGDLFSVGSGSTYAYGVLDSEHKHDLSVDEAFELARRAIYHATYRDAYSGGSINVYHMKQEGWEFKGNYNVLDLHYMYEAQKTKK